MNKRIEPNKATINANKFFAAWLRIAMEKNHISCEKLAKAIGLERKAILSYLNCQTSPKLETVAAIYAYFNCERIFIPIAEDFTWNK